MMCLLHLKRLGVHLANLPHGSFEQLPKGSMGLLQYQELLFTTNDFQFINAIEGQVNGATEATETDVSHQLRRIPHL